MDEDSKIRQIEGREVTIFTEEEKCEIIEDWRNSELTTPVLCPICSKNS